jgi:hypothetical protein
VEGGRLQVEVTSDSVGSGVFAISSIFSDGKCFIEIVGAALI